MSQPHVNEDREREAAHARAELLRRAEGVKPFTVLEDFVGDPALVADFDVDEFFRTVREDRDRP